MKKGTIYKLGAGVLALLLVAGGAAFVRSCVTDKEEQKLNNALWTRQSLRRIAYEVVLKSSMEGMLPPRDIGGLVAWIKDAGVDSIAVGTASFDFEKGILFDYWHTPVQLAAVSDSQYVLLSYGPNRKNDYGGGDDIVIGFNPQGDESEIGLVEGEEAKAIEQYLREL